MMKKVFCLLLITSLSSCGEIEEDVAAFKNTLIEMTIDECSDTEDEGILDDAELETILQECQDEILALYDVNEDGKLADDEITEANEDIKDRQAIVTEEAEAAGLSREEYKKKRQEKRDSLRTLAIEACEGDLTACKAERKIARKEMREDQRCSMDSTGECGPLTKEKRKAMRAEKIAKVDSLVKSGDVDTFKAERAEKKTEREGRKEDNASKAKAGQKARKTRGSAKRPSPK